MEVPMATKKSKSKPVYSKEFYIKSAELFKVMSNSKRLEILNLVKEREITVNELSATLGVRKSNTSQHLAYLRYVGLVTARRDGKNVYYKLVDPRIVEPCKIFSEISKKNPIKPTLFP
jgi:DNA-binding transcriptional ArsR family regulator